MTALLALHIETALDADETEINRSMARISISQTILLLNQGREIPVLKRALPVFEEIIRKKNLGSISPITFSSLNLQLQPHGDGTLDLHGLRHSQVDHGSSHWADDEHNLSVYGNLLGFDFLDDWKLDSWSSLMNVDMAGQEAD